MHGEIVDSGAILLAPWLLGRRRCGGILLAGVDHGDDPRSDSRGQFRPALDDSGKVGVFGPAHCAWRCKLLVCIA